MGLFSQDSTKTTSNAFDDRQAATDQGINNRQGGTVGGTTPFAIGGGVTGSNVVDAGGVQLQNNSDYFSGPGGVKANASNVAGAGGILLQGGSKLEVNQSSDPLVIQNALRAVEENTRGFQGTLKDLFSIQAAQQDNAHDNVAALISGQANAEQSFLDKFSSVLGSLASNQQSGGATDRNKIILYMALGILAVTAIIFWRQK